MKFKILIALFLSIFIGFSYAVTVAPPAQPTATAPKPAPKWYQEGSGFFINSDGYLVTAAHVINGTKPGTIKVRYHGTLYPASVIFEDDFNDVAVLHINVLNTKYFTLTDPINFQTAYIIGFPAVDVYGMYPHITHGEIALDDISYDSYSIFARACHGNSGGVVTNEQGDAIGILVYGFSDLSVDNGLCSYHSGARFLTQLKIETQLHGVKLTYNKIPSINLLSLLDFVTSLVYEEKVVFIIGEEK